MILAQDETRLVLIKCDRCGRERECVREGKRTFGYYDVGVGYRWNYLARNGERHICSHCFDKEGVT